MANFCAIFAPFLHPVFSASCVQRVSDLHPKFVLRPHHVKLYSSCMISINDIDFELQMNLWQTSNLQWLRLGEGKKKIEEGTTGQKYNGLPYSTGRP